VTVQCFPSCQARVFRKGKVCFVLLFYQNRDETAFCFFTLLISILNQQIHNYYINKGCLHSCNLNKLCVFKSFKILSASKYSKEEYQATFKIPESPLIQCLKQLNPVSLCPTFSPDIKYLNYMLTHRHNSNVLIDKLWYVPPPSPQPPLSFFYPMKSSMACLSEPLRRIWRAI